MKRFKQFLQESGWDETYFHVVEMCRKYPNDWIHFTDVQKLGINPSARHHDPPGIYFYQCKWIANASNHSGFQYGINKKYFYIVRVKQSDWLNLTQMKERYAYWLAEKNGWDREFMKALRYPEQYLSGNQMKKRLWKKPGAVFYGTADGLANTDIFERRLPWSKSLKGIDALFDQGSGIIHQDEPKQLVLLNPQKGKVLYSGENKPDYNRSNKVVVDAIMKDYGGSSKWDQRKLKSKFVVSGVPIEIEFDLNNYEYYIEAFVKGKKIVKRFRIDMGDWNSQTISSIKYNIKKFIEEFKPEMTGITLYWADQRKLKDAFEKIGLGAKGWRWYEFPNEDPFKLQASWGSEYIDVSVSNDDIVTFSYENTFGESYSELKTDRIQNFIFKGSFSSEKDFPKLKLEFTKKWKAEIEKRKEIVRKERRKEELKILKHMAKQ